MHGADEIRQETRVEQTWEPSAPLRKRRVQGQDLPEYPRVRAPPQELPRARGKGFTGSLPLPVRELGGAKGSSHAPLALQESLRGSGGCDLQVPVWEGGPLF